MRSFLSLFTRSWGLKIIALVLAVTIYYTLRDSSKARTHDPASILKGTSRGAQQ